VSSQPATDAVAEVLAALSYGQRRAAMRAEANVDLSPTLIARRRQEQIAAHEHERADVIHRRLAELTKAGLEQRFAPFFDAVFAHTEPADWLEAQTWHYVGDALVRDLADALSPSMDPRSAEVTEQVLADRDDQESFALDEITRIVGADGEARERVAAYARRVIGESLTQTRRALDATGAIRRLVGGEEQEKHMLLDLLQRHRQRLDRLGIERVE
jgi:hypothetical protein